MASRSAAAVTVAVLAVAFAAAWHAELWLVVVSMTAAAIVAVSRDQIANRTLAARSAAWASFATNRNSATDAFEQAMCVDLAATAANDSVAIAAALARAQRIDDPWQRWLASERLERAHAIITSRFVRPAISPAIPSSPWIRRGCLGLAVVLTGVASSTENSLVLVPVTLLVATFAAAEAEHRRKVRLSDELCKQALFPSPQLTGEPTDDAVVAMLVTLVRGRGEVLRRARASVLALPEGARQVALDRLAEVSKAQPTRAITVASLTIAWATAAGAAVALVRAL